MFGIDVNEGFNFLFLLGIGTVGIGAIGGILFAMLDGREPPEGTSADFAKFLNDLKDDEKKYGKVERGKIEYLSM